ncbi:hypothetical protein GEMRC1_002051 [Eukaryota sp. GEM-RC1]
MSRLSEASELRSLANSLLKVRQLDGAKKAQDERERLLSEATTLLQSAISNTPLINPNHNTLLSNHFLLDQPNVLFLEDAAQLAGTPPQIVSHARKYLSGALSDTEADSPVDNLYSSLLSAANEAESHSKEEFDQLKTRQDSLESSLTDLSSHSTSLENMISHLNKSIASLSDGLSSLNVSEMRSQIKENQDLSVSSLSKVENLSKVIAKHGEVVESLPALLKNTAHNTCKKLLANHEDKLATWQAEVEKKVSEVSRSESNYMKLDQFSNYKTDLIQKCENVINDALSNYSAKFIKKAVKSSESSLNEKLSQFEVRIEELSSRGLNQHVTEELTERVSECSERMSRYERILKEFKGNMNNLDSNYSQLGSDFQIVIKNLKKVGESVNESQRYLESELQKRDDTQRLFETELQKTDEKQRYFELQLQKKDEKQRLFETELQKIDEKHRFFESELQKKDQIISKLAQKQENLFNYQQSNIQTVDSLHPVISSLESRIQDLEKFIHTNEQKESAEKLIQSVLERVEQSKEEKKPKSRKSSQKHNPMTSVARDVQDLLSDGQFTLKKSTPMKSFHDSSRVAQSPKFEDYLVSNYHNDFETVESGLKTRKQLQEEAKLLTSSPRQTRPEPYQPTDFGTPSLFTPATREFENRVRDIRKNLSQL